MERKTFTVADINAAIRTAANQQGINLRGEKVGQPGLRHVVYIGKRRAKELSGDYWRTNELLTRQPTLYDGDHTAGVFDEVTGMIQESHQLTTSLGLSEEVLTEAERILFSTERESTPPPFHLKTKESQNNRTPYTFRGHNLVFAWNLTHGQQPEKIAKSIKEFYSEVKKHPELYTEAIVNAARDTIGNTPLEEANYEKTLTGVLQEFNELPDDHPIELVSGLPDNICSACIFGSHCKTKISEVRKMSMIDHDQEVLTVFVNEAQLLGQANGLATFQREASFTDSKPETVEGILTTAGVVKHILRYAPINWGELYNVFPIESRIVK
jgi:hypothetical protein